MFQKQKYFCKKEKKKINEKFSFRFKTNLQAKADNMKIYVTLLIHFVKIKNSFLFKVKTNVFNFKSLLKILVRVFRVANFKMVDIEINAWCICGVISIRLMIDWTNLSFGLMFKKTNFHKDFSPKKWQIMFFNKLI